MSAIVSWGILGKFGLRAIIQNINLLASQYTYKQSCVEVNTYVGNNLFSILECFFSKFKKYSIFIKIAFQ